MNALEEEYYGFLNSTEIHSSQKINTYNEDYLKRQSLLFFSAGITASFSASLYNSLDCLRIRWQVPSSTYPKENLIEFAQHIVRNEGFVNGLWRPGLASNAVAMGTSGALRFGFYEILRDKLQGEHNETEKSSSAMIVSGLACGCFAYLITTPFHLVKTMIQAEHGVIGTNGLYITGSRVGKEPHVTHLISGLKTLYKENGFTSLYRGVLPLAARGSTFTGGQLFGYDGFKTLCKRNGIEDGPKLHAVSGIVAAATATITSTPADYTMTRFMASKGENVRVIDIVKTIYKEGGITGFWKGSMINFSRSCPVFLTYTFTYEQLRKQLGLGFFG